MSGLFGEILQLADRLGIKHADILYSNTAPYCDSHPLAVIAPFGNNYCQSTRVSFCSGVQDIINRAGKGPMKTPQQESNENILEEATRLVTGDRNVQYGPPEDDYRRTAGVWTAMLINHKPGQPITPREACLMMAALKLCREMTAPKRDSRVDAAGYILAADWITTGVKPTSKQ